MAFTSAHTRRPIGRKGMETLGLGAGEHGPALWTHDRPGPAVPNSNSGQMVMDATTEIAEAWPPHAGGSEPSRPLLGATMDLHRHGALRM
jgi:hypothetical protein